jgi:hypothetical protein
MRKVLVLVAALVLVATPAAAQNPQNPRTVVFTASADHTPTMTYSIWFLATGATVPTQEAVLGTGTPATDGTLTFTFNSSPLAFGTNYTLEIKACVGTVCSPWSDPSNPFDRVPGKPGRPVIR